MSRSSFPGPGSERPVALTVPPSPEFTPMTDGAALLEAIAQRTGGRILTLDGPIPDDLYALSGGDGPGTVRPVWYAPLIAALSLFILDIALRLRALRGLGLPWRRSPA